MLKTRLQPYLQQIIDREITNRELAKRLDVSETYLSKVISRLNIERIPVINRQAKKQLTQTRKEYRKAIANSLPVKKAASAAGCSVRTIYRHRTK